MAHLDKYPVTHEFVKFRVILDYFASPGDKRWWHDHRFPGGVGFTLNSLGHMERTKERYVKLANPGEWGCQACATLTISNANDHPKFGKATHLIELDEGKTEKPHQCPFAKPEITSRLKLKGKDWTTYSGTHHTDHSIRASFLMMSVRPREHEVTISSTSLILLGAFKATTHSSLAAFRSLKSRYLKTSVNRKRGDEKHR